MEAAQELPKEDRQYLADSFLDELDKQYQLVPRSRSEEGGGGAANRPRLGPPAFGWWRVPFFFLPLLLLSVVFVHAPFLLLALILFVLFRFGGPGGYGRGAWRHGPRRRDTRYYL